MEPRIQYAKTEDGVSIAYWTLGEGVPFVSMPPAFTHIELEWRFAEQRRWYERLAQKRKLIRFDTRGFGLSQREVPDFSLDSMVLDLKAVVDQLHLERFALLGYQHSGPVAIAYAARCPERVSHLILWAAYAEPAEWTASSQLQATRGLIDKDWATYTETVAHIVMGWSQGEPARRYAELIRECTTPEALQAGIRATLELDVRALLPEVTSPTLVLHRRQVPFPAMSAATGLAAGIPDARLAVLEGESLAPYLGDSESVLRAIEEFLSEGDEEAAETPAPGGFATILFTDMESSTALTQQLGDAGAQEVRRAHNEIVRAALNANSGTEIKHTGDGIMASFATASAGLDCAIAIQRGVAAHKDEQPDSPLGVYVGLNAGEPIAEDDPDGRVDLFGTSVDLAARLVDHAQPGQIIASDVVRQLAAGKQFLFADLGETELRGFEDPVKLWELRWEQDAPA